MALASTCHVEPLALDLKFGAKVVGLNRSHLEDPAVRKTLYDLWIDKGVLHFAECEPSVDFHLELSSTFGQVERHAHRELWADGNPQICQQSTGGDNDILYEVDGELAPTYIPWHSDMVYMAGITHGTMLRMLTPTTRGGMTGFIDQIWAYETLPNRLKQRIEGQRVIYKMHVQLTKNPLAIRGRKVKLISASPYFQSMLEREDKEFPPVTHPLVFEQPETGRKVLNLSPMFARRVEGLSQEESDELLIELVDHLVDEEKAYYHQWKMTDYVLWDNWRTIHCATPSPVGEVRTIQRSVIAGDYNLGRSLELEDRSTTTCSHASARP